jgi:hypothetical protein
LFFQAIKIDEALSQYLGEAKNLPVEDGTFFNILYRHIIFNVFFVTHCYVPRALSFTHV